MGGTLVILSGLTPNSLFQSLVVSEVSWLYTVIFYSFCLLVIYLVTATRRKAYVRLWLFLILTVNFGLERFVINVSLMEQEEAAKIILEMVISFVTLVIMAIRFKVQGLQPDQQQAARGFQKQNLELKEMLDKDAGRQGDREKDEDEDRMSTPMMLTVMSITLD